MGVDLNARTNGGLCALVPETPPRHIVLLQRKKSRLGASLGKTSSWVHRATLQRKGVQMLAGVEYRKIDDEGLHVTVGGESRLLQVDHVIICAGQDSFSELVPQQANPVGPRFHLIGGAALAAELDAKRAIREGAELAASL
jgi:2,4-dienoyl-CoA reductase (NADPH2)